MTLAQVVMLADVENRGATPAPVLPREASLAELVALAELPCA